MTDKKTFSDEDVVNIHAISETLLKDTLLTTVINDELQDTINTRVKILKTLAVEDGWDIDDEIINIIAQTYTILIINMNYEYKFKDDNTMFKMNGLRILYALQENSKGILEDFT
jgi:hypothetical protein